MYVTDTPQFSSDRHPDWYFKYVFTEKIFASVVQLTQAARPPSYKVVLDIDRRIRETQLPPALDVFFAEQDPHGSPRVYMKAYALSQFRSTVILYIHRSFFVQALLDHPDNPLKSPYAPSFLAVYRAASDNIRLLIEHIKCHWDLTMRCVFVHWFCWRMWLTLGVVLAGGGRSGRICSLLQ